MSWPSFIEYNVDGIYSAHSCIQALYADKGAIWLEKNGCGGGVGGVVGKVFLP